MTPHILTLAAFLFLALAVCAVWSKPLLAGKRVAVHLWLLLFVMAAAWGLVAGVLRPAALAGLLVFGASAWATANARQQPVRLLAGVVTAVLALALAMHKLPGFNNPVVIAGAVLSPGAAPFTQYANFDKGAVGLILLAVLCNRMRAWSEPGGMLKKTWPVLIVTVAAVLGFAMATGFVRPDFKLPAVTVLFLAVNLFFTVVAEEAFFRGFLQARLAASLSRFSYGPWIAMVVSALLFGAAHLAGGPLYGILAFIAGLGYAYAYQVTQRIEAAILVHIMVNAVHFIGFTYPYSA
ncbi:lysostaphin resistance A-like protein [Duganella sp. CT11-25]|uniref:CPBP family intramembrane glutamic endopeptidase n=1 Tax=unclassified Duganella TaxID=2636909 RepID=UPI0039B0017F